MTLLGTIRKIKATGQTATLKSWETSDYRKLHLTPAYWEQKALEPLTGRST